MIKKILLVAVFISFLLGGFCLAQGRTLEIDYPQLGVQDVQQPTTTKAFLPAYIEYIFTWGIIIAGLLAFFALVFGGILYMTSGGNPSKISDAREQIIAGFLGLIILLSSFLILKTIDPQLVILEKPTMEQAIGGIKIYSMDKLPGCLESENEPSLLISSSIPKLFEESILGTILDWGDKGKNKIEWIKFLNEPDELTIKFHSENEYGGTLIKTYDNYKKGNCTAYDGSQPMSIKLDYHLPGVYLYANSTDCGTNKIDKDKPVEIKVYQGSSATLPEFDNETKSIKFVYGDKDEETNEYQIKYAAILHEHENFMGKAMLFDQGESDKKESECKSLSENMYDGDPKDISVSSITVYQKPIEDPFVDKDDEGVRFWDVKSYNGCVIPPKETDKYGEEKDIFYGDDERVAELSKIERCVYDDECLKSCDSLWRSEITSLEMHGNYIALLFDGENFDKDCEVFTKSDPWFRDNRIGQCGLLGRTDCLSSFIIKARK